MPRSTATPRGGRGGSRPRSKSSQRSNQTPQQPLGQSTAKKQIPSNIKPKPSLSSDILTPQIQSDLVFFSDKPDQKDDTKKRGRQKVSPVNNDPQKRIKMDDWINQPSTSSNPMPISQFNAPNVAYQRTNKYALTNLQQPDPIQKNGKMNAHIALVMASRRRDRFSAHGAPNMCT